MPVNLYHVDVSSSTCLPAMKKKNAFHGFPIYLEESTIILRKSEFLGYPRLFLIESMFFVGLIRVEPDLKVCPKFSRRRIIQLSLVLPDWPV
jgi:hypothetical protein